MKQNVSKSIGYIVSAWSTLLVCSLIFSVGILTGCDTPRRKVKEDAGTVQGNEVVKKEEPKQPVDKSSKKSPMYYPRPIKVRAPIKGQLKPVKLDPRVKKRSFVAPHMRYMVEQQLDVVIQALEMYASNHEGLYPDSLEQLAQEQGLTFTPRDPWGRKYTYKSLGNSYTLFSNGPDGKPRTDDDVGPKTY